jgi:hypothetical protein
MNEQQAEHRVGEINQTTFSPNPAECTVLAVNGGPFRIGDLVRPDGQREVLYVFDVPEKNVVRVRRQYGGTPASSLTNKQRMIVLGNVNTNEPQQVDEPQQAEHVENVPPVQGGGA